MFWLDKSYARKLLLVFLLFLPVCLSHAETNSLVIETVGIGKDLKLDAAKVHHVFGGQTVNFILSVYGPAGEKFEIKADLIQGATSIVAPIQKDIPVVSDLDFSRSVCQKVDFPVTMPAVERSSTFYLRYRFRSAGEKKWRNAGNVDIRVYPPDILKPVQEFAKKNTLYLYGENETLSRFFPAKEIKVEDMRDNFPKAEKQPCLIFAEYLDNDWFKLPKELPDNQVVIVFYPASKKLPKLIIKQLGKGTMIEVKMELLSRLMQDPEAQESFMEIFNNAVECLPINKNQGGGL